MSEIGPDQGEIPLLLADDFVAGSEGDHLLHLQTESNLAPSGINSAMASGMVRSLDTGYLPFHFGSRFSRNALMPSCASSVFIKSSR